MGWKEKEQVFLAEFSKVTEGSVASDFKRYVQSITHTDIVRVIRITVSIQLLLTFRIDLKSVVLSPLS